MHNHSYLQKVFIFFALIAMSLAAHVKAAQDDSSEAESATVLWTATGQSGHFSATLSPVAGKLMLGTHSAFVLTLKRGEQNVDKASIGISAGMFGEGHGHGMPASPKATQYMGDGKYLIEGVLFNMMGEWTFFFDVEYAGKRDRIRIDLNFDHTQL